MAECLPPTGLEKINPLIVGDYGLCKMGGGADTPQDIAKSVAKTPMADTVMGKDVQTIKNANKSYQEQLKEAAGE